MRVTSAAILLVYCTLLLPPLCFCINCPLERVALDLSDTPPPHPHPSSLWRGGGAAHPPDPNPPPPNTGGQLRSPWMGDENCVGGRCKRSSSPPQFSSPIHGLLTADRQCLGGGGIRVRPPPTPQAGRVTDSHGGEG
jgi:hypothetical protein